MDQTRMRILSLRSLIRLIRSMPLPVLREISTTATSGMVLAIKGRASLISAASPQTSRSDCRPIRKASASRTAGWSSTIKTRVRFFAFFCLIGLPWQCARDDGALGFGRRDGHGRADKRGAVAHDAKPQALMLRWPGCHADAVVLHLECQPSIGMESDADHSRPSVFDGIVDRLLGDEIKVGCSQMVCKRNRFRAIKRARDFR